MKLILCGRCGDVLKLRAADTRFCECGASSGRYLEDGEDAVYSGSAIPLGIFNSELESAVTHWREHQPRIFCEFTAFVFDRDTPSFKRAG